MKKIILAILTLSIFAIGADKPTHYINNKWRVCDENTYDAKGNLVHQRYNWGGELWYEYDSTGNLTRSTDGAHLFVSYYYIYNEQNHMIRHSTLNDNDSIFESWWCEYDDKGNYIYEKSYDRETWFEYDEKGQIIHKRINDSYESLSWYEYDRYSNPTRRSFIVIDDVLDTISSHYEYFTSDGKKLKATYGYNKKNPYHVKPVGTVLRCKK